MSQRGKYIRSPETLARMSESARGNQHWLGKKHRDESKAKIAASNRKHYAQREQSDGYWAIHKWMRQNFAKTGVCEGCGKIAAAVAHDFACVGHDYSRRREDCKELCRACHKKLDLGTHCKSGHAFTDENTYQVAGGGRQCRTCRREAHLRRKLRHQEVMPG